MVNPLIQSATTTAVLGAAERDLGSYTGPPSSVVTPPSFNLLLPDVLIKLIWT
jgi:hypothetical protein